MSGEDVWSNRKQKPQAKHSAPSTCDLGVQVGLTTCASDLVLPFLFHFNCWEFQKQGSLMRVRKKTRANCEKHATAGLPSSAKERGTNVMYVREYMTREQACVLEFPILRDTESKDTCSHATLSLSLGECWSTGHCSRCSTGRILACYERRQQKESDPTIMHALCTLTHIAAPHIETKRAKQEEKPDTEDISKKRGRQKRNKAR